MCCWMSKDKFKNGFLLSSVSLKIASLNVSSFGLSGKISSRIWIGAVHAEVSDSSTEVPAVDSFSEINIKF